MNQKERLGYGFLALPLALIGLPLYVYLPTLLVQVTELDLVTVGTLLLSARLIEAVCDPFLGKSIARLHQKRSQMLQTISTAVSCLLAGFVLLILTSPYWLAFASQWSTHALARAGLLQLCVLIAYLAYGWLSIVHYTLGTQWVARGEVATRLYGVREALALTGVLLGSLLPLATNWTGYGLVCAGLILLGMWTLKASWINLMLPCADSIGATADHLGTKPVQTDAVAKPALDVQIKRVLIVFFISTLAGSLPASLLGFYVADVLGLGDAAPQFLAIYFSAGALGFALWPRLAAHYAPTRLWSMAMFFSALSFCFALLLRADTPHVALWFGVVCGATGLLLGAEWMLPQSVVATRLSAIGQSDQAGRVFGLWTWAQKTALAIATGVALWGLAALGYVPSSAAGFVASSPNNIAALIVLYCLVPAVMKSGAAFAAWQLTNSDEQVKD